MTRSNTQIRADKAPKFTPRQNRKLLKRAVHRNRLVSRAGIQERLFTTLFSGLVYPQTWEDPEVDLAAMELTPEHHVVAIASGGCNVMSYLTGGPARITAVDLNSAHVALLRLKLAALNGLPDWDSYFRFFGEANSRQNVRDYDALLRPRLDAETRAYWEKRQLPGRRRISVFKSGFYRKGLLGRFIGAGHMAARLFRVDLAPLLEAKNLGEQREYFNTRLAPLFQKKFVRWLTSRRAALFGLGIPPAQFEALAGSRNMADVLSERLENLTCGFPMAENYFAWQAFGRRYSDAPEAALPPYLQERHFRNLQSWSGRVAVEHISMTTRLEQLGAGSVDRVVLLDAQDWMTDEQLNGLWSAIMAAAKPGARVIFRTAGAETILPGRVRDQVLSRWTYLAESSARLGAQDRSAIYGGFHIYELAPHA